MFLLDTNICIYFMKNKYPKLTEKLMSHHPSELCISAITVFELEYGAVKSNWGERTRHQLAMFLAPFNILQFDSSDACAAAEIRAFLESQGNIIGPYDIQLAGQAISKQLIFVTHNVDEFSRIPSLKIEDWVI